MRLGPTLGFDAENGACWPSRIRVRLCGVGHRSDGGPKVGGSKEGQG